MDPVLIAFGLGVGVLVGTTGVGGGSLMTPLLILVVGVKPVVAIGTDLAYAAVTKTVGGWQHFRKGTVDLRMSLWLGVGSLPGALGGVWVLERLHDRYGSSFDSTVLYLVASALLVTAVAVLVRAIFLRRAAERERHTVDMQTRHKVTAVVTGVTVGFVLGVTSAGSGALIALALILFFRMTPHRVVGTDVFHAAVLLWVAGAAHFAAGNVDLLLAGNILLGSVPGVIAGAHLSTRLPQEVLRVALGLVLLASGLGLLTKAGADIPPFVIVGVPAAVGLLTWLARRGRGEPPVSAPRAGAALPASERA